MKVVPTDDYYLRTSDGEFVNVLTAKVYFSVVCVEVLGLTRTGIEVRVNRFGGGRFTNRPTRGTC